MTAAFLTSYTVTTIAGCKIVRGPIPVSDMAGLSKMVPRAEIDGQLARRLGANLVFGTPRDLKALREMRLPPCHEIQAEVERARAAGVGDAACDWLLNGERGTSSDTLFSAITNVVVMMKGCHPDTPHDPGDLRRCRLLLDRTGWTDQITKVADVVPAWRDIAASWEQLCKTMDSETPAWRRGVGEAPRTMALLESLQREA